MPSQYTYKPNRPVHEIAYGALTVAIWKKEGEHVPFFPVSRRRRYKDKATDKWKDSHNYGQDGLLALGKLPVLAHTWIFTEQQQKRVHKAA